MPLECKAGLSLDSRSLRGIADYLNDYDQPLGAIVSFAPFGTTEIEVAGFRRRQRVVMLPVPLLERLGPMTGT